MNTNEEKYYDNCFTEIEEGKVNAEFNKATLTCFDSKNNKFSMDCEGNLVVNSIITRELSPTTGLTIDDIYPVGSIYMSVANANPANLFGGTWEQIKDRFLLSVGDNNSSANVIGGSTETGSCTLTIDQIPSHSHEVEAGGKKVGGFPTNNIGFDMAIAEYSNSGLSVGTICKTGGDGSHKHSQNLPPYLTVYMWKRTA